MLMLYKSCIESVLTFLQRASLCLKARISLSKRVKISSKMLGVKPHRFTELYDRQQVGKREGNPLSQRAAPFILCFSFYLLALDCNRYRHIQALLYPFCHLPSELQPGSKTAAIVMVMMLL